MTRFFRTGMATLGAFAFSLSLLPPVGAQSLPAFRDVGSSQYEDAINALREKGVVEGYQDLTFRPAARINRAEFLKIILESRGFNAAQTSDCFPDVTTQWFARYVCNAKNEGIISGYPDGTFKAEQEITFTEAAKILSLAYKQQTQTGGEWYEGYARALESSKAIPPTIEALDYRVTRGEMAEMMWRLSENKTDEPSKGFLNVKYPELKVNTSSDEVQFATSCTDLRAFMQSQMGYGGGIDMYYNKAVPGAPAPMMDAAEGATTAATRQSGTTNDDYSRTNTQVDGVDEGDIVKTDGTNLYVLSNQTIRIVKARPGSSMQKLSEIELAPEAASAKIRADGYYPVGGFQPTDLYIEDGKLIVLGSDFRSGPTPMLRDNASAKMMIWPPYGSSRSTVKIYDVRDPAKPSLIRTVSFDGSTVSSRRIGDKFYLVLNSQMPYWDGPHIMSDKAAATADATVPRMDDSAVGTERAVAPCDRIAILPRVPNPQYLTVAVIPVDAKAEVKSSVVLGNAQNVYMSTENLYLASTDYRYSWGMEDSANPKENREPAETTRLYRFELGDAGATYKAQGSVPGHILNQFSMDEHGPTFRIATTLSQDWNVPNSHSSNNLYTLSRDLKQVGKIEDIAPGESIFAARFLGNRVYLVTFKQVDPLFVIDTSDARNPKILGKLKIPGYSNYLHPIDDNHVLGIGKEVDESIDADKVHSDDAVYYTAVQGLKIAVFDVRDVSKPKELWKEVVGDRGTESEVLNNHKALLYEPDTGLLSLPITVTKRPDGSDKSAEANPVFQGAYVYDVSISGGIKREGTITHYADNQDFLKAGSYWWGGPRDIKRIVRIGQSLLTISDSEIRSSALSGLKKEGSVEYPFAEQVNPPMYLY